MSVRSNHITSLLCITLGVALCAAYGGRLPSDTRARLITLKQLEKIPVDESQIVAHDVVPVVGKLHGLSSLLAASLAFELAVKHLTRQHVKSIELVHELAR